MAITSKHSAAQSASITFITIGVIMTIPSAVWYTMFNPEGVGKFFCATFFLLGLAFVIIGLSVGYIGRSARQAELPPPGATATVLRQEPAAENRAATPAQAPAPAPSPVVGTPSSTVVQTG
jgi:hypothetical protein